MKCIRCRQGLTWECEKDGNCNELNNDSPSTDRTNDSSSSGEEAGQSEAESIIEEDTEDENGPVRIIGGSHDHALRDQQSTGRKRAAEMYPLKREDPCEWKMKKNVGGGQHPIIGCINGLQQARHHGPDKNTLNNDKGNVHRICHNCHNRWHTMNDEGYAWGTIQNEHAPVEASGAEIGQNELYWAKHKTVKANDDK